jgi:hypothetical protein
MPRIRRLLRARGTPSVGGGGSGDAPLALAVTATTSDPVASWTDEPTADYTRVFRSTDPYIGMTQINVDGATTGTSYTDTTAVAGTRYFYEAEHVIGGVATSRARSRTGGKQGSGSTITPGAMTLTPTYHNIGIEVAYTGDADLSATAWVEWKPTAAADDGAVWRHGLPMDQIPATSDLFFGGSITDCEPNTEYDVRVTIIDSGGVTGSAVVTGTVTTLTEPAQLYNTTTWQYAGTPNYYVTTSGNDSTGNGSQATPWRTIEKALSTASAGTVVLVGPGRFYCNNNARGSGITIVAQYAAVDDEGNVVNSGNHTLVEHRYDPSPIVSGPTGASSTYSEVTNTPWVLQTGVTGPNSGSTYSNVYKWTGGAPGVDQIAFAATRTGQLTRIPGFKDSGMNAARWIEHINENGQQHFGQHRIGSDLYVRLPNDVDPNTQYIVMGGSSAILGTGTGMRFTGLVFRIFTSALHMQSGAADVVIDHCWFDSCQYGVRFTGSSAASPDTYVDQATVQYCRFTDTLWSTTHTNSAVGATPVTSWASIKSGTFDTWGSISRTCENSEGGAVFQRGGARGFVFRHNVVDGPFNGITSNNTDYDRHATEDVDIYGNLFTHISDDSIEPELLATNWRIYDNRFESVGVGMSTAPLNYGPIYFFRNRLWRRSSLGSGREDTGRPGVGSCLNKYSNGASATLYARLYYVHNTDWTDQTYNDDPFGGTTSDFANKGVDGIVQNAGGGTGSEAFTLRNNIVRTSRYAFQSPAAGKWDEDYNLWVTSHASNGISYNGNSTTGVATYRAYSGNTSGDHTNILNGSDVNFNAEATVDALFTDPTGGDLTLKSGTNHAVGAAVPFPNISDLTYLVDGVLPDLGYAQRS